ncbi:tetratricopeptide repeat protein [Alteromonadaceae bacterium BrNp21-10]|nr:tetratricopeptide repeat protein [Alteromonadaceae bacterium BrNp21-10]
MNIIKHFWVVVFGVVLLTACSSLPESASQPSQDMANPVTPSMEVDNGAAVASPKQQLLAQTNYFKQSQPSISKRVKQRMTAALALKQKQQFADAEAAFSTLADEFADLSMVWLHLGDIAYAQSHIDEAIGHYQQAINSNKFNYFAHNRLGHLLRHQGQFASALQHYQQAIQAWPGFAQAYLNRGILLDLYRGDKTAALADYQTYQMLTDDSDNHIKSWIADLGRQLDVQ